MSRFTKKNFQPLDQEEKNLVESIEKDDWQPVKNLDQAKKTAIQAAKNTLKKYKRII
jgi:predicted DNA binding CopG/RHH family protein